MFLEAHEQALINAWRTLRSKPFSTILLMLIIATPLTLPLIFWSALSHVQTTIKTWPEGSHIYLYLQTTLSGNDQKLLLNKVQQLPLVEQAMLKSPEQGLAELAAEEGMQDIIHDLQVSPLPPIIEVTPKAVADSSDKIKVLYQSLQALPGVESTQLDLEWLTKLFTLFGTSVAVGNGFMCLLLIGVLLMIGNAMRLILYTRHDEVRVLKLIGATDAFIVRPFLYLGLLYGVFSAVLAVLLGYLFLFSAGQFLAQTALGSYFTGFGMQTILLFIVCMGLLGWLSARISIKRQLTSHHLQVMQL